MKSKKALSGGTKDGYIFILPAFFYMLLVLGYPLVYNLVLSFKNVDVKNFTKGGSVFVGLENYIHLFNDDTFLLVLRNTFIFTIACLVFQFTIGFAFAMFFNQKFKVSGPIRGMILVSYMMPMSVTGLLGKNIFANDGLVNDLLSKIGINGPEWLVTGATALIAVIIMNCWVGIPFNMLLLMSGLTSVSQDVYESASIDGANWVEKFVFITLPLMKGSIMAVLMLGFIYTFRAFDLMYIMTAGGPLNATDVLGTYSYVRSFTQFEFSEGSAIAMVLFACLFVIGLFYLRLLAKEDD
ncbi:MAG TPA: sugar ABC transporter permease [Candidatus Blautia faecigallinarum]|uniref:Sugar ABC transporter permease n=1 Tax=Candidatus Blautia faecigallinarum TaxID=2838488 RepID=A0A9D2DU27_9FIRM|nr:sugar ABC transporter permease [Candidatus Blautia faecigallinarum]